MNHEVLADHCDSPQVVGLTAHGADQRDLFESQRDSERGEHRDQVLELDGSRETRTERVDVTCLPREKSTPPAITPLLQQIYGGVRLVPVEP